MQYRLYRVVELLIEVAKPEAESLELFRGVAKSKSRLIGEVDYY